MKAQTAYKFRVRVVTPEGEGPYSPESNEYKTLMSTAQELLKFCKCKKKEDPPQIYALPLTELKNARNTNAKTRKMEIGKTVCLYLSQYALFM